MNVFTSGSHAGFCDCKLGVWTWYILFDVRLQVSRRTMTMTMELVYFLAFIAASGVVIMWYWQKSVWARRGENSTLSGGRHGQLSDEPFPPFRKTVSGESETESDRTKLLNRIDVWQREHQVGNSLFNHSTNSLQGTKYTFTPRTERPPSKAESIKDSASRQAANPDLREKKQQRFVLI